MEMERNERAQRMPVPQSQQGAIPARLYVEGMTLAEKAKYGAWAAGGSFIGAEVFGFGASGVLVGLAAGGVAMYFSEDIRNKIIDRLPSPQRTRSRRMDKVNWFLTGREPLYEDDQATDDDDLYYEDFEDDDQALDVEEEEQLTGRLDMGPVFKPHADMVLSNRSAILGMPGAGKTNLVTVIAEELARYRAPQVIFDHKPEYGGLCNPKYFPHGYRAGAHNLQPSNAFEFAYELMNKRLQVVIDLRSYKNDDIAAAVMINLIAGIWEWEESLHNDDRIPCTLILDEAHYWLPQADSMSTVNRQIERETGHSLYSRLQQTFFNVVNGGRSFGIGIILSTQRPANIDKRAISVAEWKFLLKANMPNDLEVYKKLGVSEQIAQSLAKGEAYIIGPGDIKGRYQMRKRYSPDESKTPGLAALKKNTSQVPAVNRLPSGEPSVYSGINVNTPINTPEYADVNAHEEPSDNIINGVFNKQSVDDEFELETGDTSLVNVNVNSKTQGVSAETRDHIRRMYEAGFAHREISQIVKLYGPKYGIYKAVCAEEGVEINDRKAR